jgi:hypothetical protein
MNSVQLYKTTSSVLVLCILICDIVKNMWDNTKWVVCKLQLYYEFGTHFDFVICSYCYLYLLLDQFVCWTVGEFIPIVFTF